MKNLLFASVCLLTVICQKAVAETYQATIKNGRVQNSVILAIRPNTTTSAAIGTINFSIAVPVSAGITPVASIPDGYNFNSKIVYTIQQPSSVLPQIPTTPETIDGVSYYIYNLVGIGDASAAGAVNYTQGVDNNMVEVKFGQIPPSNQAVTVRLINRIGGGSSSNAYFYVAAGGGVDKTNYPSLFYGSGAVNAGGTDSDQNSYVPLSGVILPTKFLSFYANKSDDNAKLTWTVDNEEDNAYFEVEASTDARSFTTIQKVNALRNGRSSNTYNLTDSRISRYNVGVVYYRIKQVEANNRVIYSDVRQVTLDGKNFVAALYPNPVKTVTKLVIEAPEAGKATVIIRDATGKAVKQLNLQLQKGTNQQELDASVLAAGDYNVTIISDKLNQTIKMTKSN